MIFFAAPIVHADSCSVISAQDQQSCCISPANAPQCEEYQTTLNPTATQGQLNGGAQATAPVNDTSSLSYPTATTSSVSPSVPTSTGVSVSTCSSNPFTSLLSIAIWAKCIIGEIIIPGIFTLAFVVFLWGVFKFIRASDKADKDESKQFIYMGLIGLFVMVSVWGIINIFTTTFGFNSTVPTLQTSAPTTTPTSSGTGISQ